MHGGIGYNELKELLLREPVVAYPDFSIPFRFYMDASNIGLGAILAQEQEGKERIICCASRTLNKSEQNYIATEKNVWPWFGESRISEII